MVFQKFWVSDNAVANIDSAISASTTTITLWTWEGAKFPVAWGGATFVPTLVQYVDPGDETSWVAKSEKILVTNRSWDVLTVTRWYDWDTPTSFLSWDFLYLNVTSKVIEDIQDEVERLEDDKLNKWGLRTALANAWKMFFSNGSNNETELTFWASGTVLQSNWTSSAPTWEVPTVNINSLTEDTTWNIDNDQFVKNNGTWWNTKVKLTKYIANNTDVNNPSENKKFVTPSWINSKYWINSYSITTLTSPPWVFSSTQYSSSIQMNIDAIINVYLTWLSSWTNPNFQWIQYSVNNSTWVDLYTRVTWSWWVSNSENIIFRVQKWYYIRLFQWWTWSLSGDASVIVKLQN